METGAGFTWLVAGTIAASLSALAAATSAFFSAVALRTQTRAVDLSSYLGIFERRQQFERRLKAPASDHEEWLFVRREYLNFLECIAHLYIDRRFGSGTASLCRDTLSDSIAAIEIDEDTRTLFEESVTSSETYVYLVKFRKKHKPVIEQRKAIFGELRKKGRLR